MKTQILFLLLLASTCCAGQVVELTTTTRIPEISGMIKVQGQYWALGDGGNPARLYLLDTSDGQTPDSTTFANASNNDWEELACNTDFVFVGDFGNNNGTRKDLRIYRFPISALGQKNVVADTIAFHYPDQTDFSFDILSEFDCEAMVALPDSILLFSKSKTTALCRMYSLPNKPGNFAARLLDTLQLDFWVTGATGVQDSSLLLCGYGFDTVLNLSPALYHCGFGKNRIQRKGARTTWVTLNQASQLESIVMLKEGTTVGACEASNGKPAELYRMGFGVAKVHHSSKPHFFFSPNPTFTVLNVDIGILPTATLEIRDSQGRMVKTLSVSQKNSQIDISGLPNGNYSLTLLGANRESTEPQKCVICR